MVLNFQNIIHKQKCFPRADGEIFILGHNVNPKKKRFLKPSKQFEWTNSRLLSWNEISSTV